MKNEICNRCPHEDTEKCETCEKRVCRVCGCTWNNACPGGCYCVEFDLCSECVGKKASGKGEERIIQRLVYTVDIDEEFSDLIGLFELLESIVEDELDCNVIRSSLETEEEIISKGDWDDEQSI